MTRHFIDKSAESIRVAGCAAYKRRDVSLLREAVSELSRFRTSGEARRVIENLAPLLSELEGQTSKVGELEDRVHPSRKWLSGVEAVASQYGAKQSTDSCSVYLVLLRGVQSPNEFGVYVGMTSQAVEERFHDHKSGHKSSRHVRKFGVRLLRPFFDHLEGISREDAETIERDLAASLKVAGYWVEGGH